MKVRISDSLFDEFGVIIPARFGTVTSGNQKEVADVFAFYRFNDFVSNTQNSVAGKPYCDLPIVGIIFKTC